MNTERRAYKSDVSDEQWQWLGPELERLTPPSHLGQPRKVDLRKVYNTIQYQARSGCQWDMLPHDLLPKSTVYDYFKRWRDDGTLDRLNAHVVKLVRRADSSDRGSSPVPVALTPKRCPARRRAKAADTTEARKSGGESGISWSIPNQHPFNYPQKPASAICLQSEIV